MRDGRLQWSGREASKSSQMINGLQIVCTSNFSVISSEPIKIEIGEARSEKRDEKTDELPHRSVANTMVGDV